MLFRSLVSLVCVAVASVTAAHEHGGAAARRAQATATATTTSGPDYELLRKAFQGYLQTMTYQNLLAKPTETLAISVPSSLRNEIITAVPMGVLVSMMEPSYRSSVASDFQAGSPPAWYTSLDPSLKSYFENMATSIQGGKAVYTVTPTTTATTQQAAPTTTSSDGLAAPTGISDGVVAGVVGMAGVLGLALAL